MIKVLLFAQLKDELGQEALSIEGNGLTVGQLKGKMTEDFHVQGLDAVMTAVNEEFADEETVRWRHGRIYSASQRRLNNRGTE